MNASLTVVVPVYNAQEVLAKEINELLEILSDHGSPFEVVIVDDASTDQTIEVAHELAQQYPQLHVVGHHQRLGVPTAARTGAAAAQGDYVFVHETWQGGSRQLRCMLQQMRQNNAPSHLKSTDRSSAAWTSIHTSEGLTRGERPRRIAEDRRRSTW